MTTTANLLDQVKIYVGTYAKYNNGSIEGEWLTLGDSQTLEEFYAFCADLHSDETDPEFMFQDFETPEILKGMISECGIDENIFEVAELLDGKDEDIISAYLSVMGEKLSEDTINDAEEKFYGHFESDEEFGEDYAEQTDMLNSMPENLKYYFDFKSFGRDLAFDFMEFNGYYFSN